MGRRERPVDPADGPVAAFAVELRKLRQEAGGPSYRAMAARVPCSAATLAQAAAGDRFATLPVTLAYVQACGGDTQQWRTRWQEALAAVREATAVGGDMARAPYRGLARFETADQAYFFGRTALVERVADLVDAHRLVVVVGPSGCGKSSLLRAGLVPRLRPRAVRVVTPGAHPQAALPEAAADEVIVVDQFEETFTLCQDPDERQAFIDALVNGQAGRVVLAVRADFFDHCARHPALMEAVRDSTVPVGPMSRSDLREAITKPAAAAGLIVQRELTATLIEEVADEPGGLPLMSHALLETWRRHHGKALTLADYEATGGIHGAVAHTAENLYTDLTPTQRQRLRELLLRLVTPGQAGAQDTRRPVRRAELLTGDPLDPGPVLLEQLAAARLITLDDDTADLAHEALLTAWPRLRDWVEEDRERLRVHRRLTEAATTWNDHARDPGTLYRGLQLATAQEHLTQHLDTLTPEERAFLHAGTAAHHGARRRRGLRTSVLSVVVVLALVAASLAWQQNTVSSRRQREAHARQMAGTAESLRQSDPRLAMQLSLAAWRLADLPETRAALRTAGLQPEQDTFTDPDQAEETMRWLSADGRSLISAGATQVTRWDLDTRQRLSVAPGLGALLPNTGVGSGDARWLPVIDRATAEVTLWDLVKGRHDLRPLDTANQGSEIAPSGRYLITYHAAGSRYRVSVWDPGTRRQVLRVSTPRKKKPAARKQTWIDGALAREQHSGRARSERDTPDAVLSADDRTLALCVPGAPLQLWDLPSGRRRELPGAPVLSGQQCRDERVSLAPDGRRLLLTTETKIRQWELPSGKEGPYVDELAVHDVSFSADGALLMAAGVDGYVVLRMSQLDSPLFRYPYSGANAASLHLDPAANRVRFIVGSRGGTGWPATVRTLQLSTAPDTLRYDERSQSATFSLTGDKLATVYRDRVELRDVKSGRRLPGPPPVPCPGGTFWTPRCWMIAGFRHDGQALAYGDRFGGPFSAKVWDLTQQRVTAVSPPIPFAAGLAFAGGGGTLLAVGQAGDVRTSPSTSFTSWDIRAGTAPAKTPGLSGDTIIVDPRERVLVTSRGDVADLAAGRVIPRTTGPGPGKALAFSRDASLFAVGDAAGQIALWDGDVRRHLGTLTPASASGPVTALAFSADGQVLAAGRVNGDVQLWDTALRQPIGAPIRTPAGTVLALRVDNEALYVAGIHVPLLRYDLTPAAAAAAVCRRTGQGLTAENWSAYFPGYPYQSTCGGDAHRNVPDAPRAGRVDQESELRVRARGCLTKDTDAESIRLSAAKLPRVRSSRARSMRVRARRR
ncbi:AAA family ATPase [Nonomuraea sp. WAC 01424]|uniref:nSTAND1 domain-containing NTPase n=1 Tax=Nonomuraea sp. WAC 01424 TaxID=2203200 RepID=UPI000F78BB17|nr:AAA family ATPase [Nonomuraea sp. WAC 01424]